MANQMWWYVARAGGIVALTLTSLSVIWGLLLSTRILQGRPTAAWLLDLHRFFGGLAVVFTGVHLAGLVGDTFVHFGLAELFVPFASAWKTGAVAWGIVAFYLLLAVEITSLLMHRMPRTWWKRIHLSSYVLFWTGVLHGATAGTDAGNVFYVGAMVTLIVTVAGLTLHHILTARKFRGVFTDRRALTPAG